ncbi:hypothetical protein [Propionivibrio sp.]|uniref:hypothetical protein n=1 Tax=Propionivibrio sp. TaxID=2212460 RepID=UPI003BF2DAF1
MCPISGGNWNNASNAGLWMLNLNNVRGNTNNNVGCRADSISPPQRLILGHSGIQGDAFRRGVASTTATPAKSAGFRLSGRAAFRLEGQAS